MSNGDYDMYEHPAVFGKDHCHNVAAICWAVHTYTGGARGGQGGDLPPRLLLEIFSNSRLDSKVVTFWHGGKKNWKKKKLLLGWKWLNHYFCLVLCNLHLFHYFLFYIIIYTIFTIYDTFHSILFLNDARDITSITTYVLQIGMSSITKNNF